MTRFIPGTRKALLALMLAGLTTPLIAQDAGSAETRIRKLEAEVRALQGKVFPGGDGKFFPAQVQAAQPATASGGTPATTPVTDLLARTDAVEAQLARLTAQSETNANRLAQLEVKLAALSPAPAVTVPAAAPTPAPSTAAVTPAPKPPAPAPKPAAVAPSAQRLAAVRAIEKPATGDAGDDAYSYGYRLWEAKFYPEAELQLKMFLEKYPRHARVSFARNLLGRAYLDEGKPRDAAEWFFQNHQADPTGPRASDSLLFLAESMRRLKDTNRACIALAQFADDYPAETTGRLKAQYDATRGGVKCN